MPGRRATLAGMSLAHLDRILAFVCDVIDAQGGDWDATEALLRRTYDGEDAESPLKDIKVMEQVSFVMKGGVVVRGPGVQ